MKQRDERSLTDRTMSDREATELDEVLFRDPNNLTAFTPPARAGEHLRWVRKTPTDEGAYRSRVAQGYRAVRYSDYPEFPPYKNLIAAAAVQPDETIMHKDDLILMMCSERYAVQRGRHYGELAHRQNVGAHQASEIPQMRAMPLTDASESSTTLQRVRRPREASFGE